MIDFSSEDLFDKITELSNIKYEKNFAFGDGKSSQKIINILKNIDYNDTDKHLSY